MIKNFFKCGLIGWCAEILFTSTSSILDRDWRLSGTTSLWMFPIYGMAAFFPYLYRIIKQFHFLIRGFIYTVCIFAVEFLSGLILTFFHVCPWDYSNAALNYKGIIRLDYAPLWFLLGLFYEKILTNSKFLRRLPGSNKNYKKSSVVKD